MMRRFIYFIMVTAVAFPLVSGGQTITGVDGEMSEGTSVIISGISFGTKSPAAPLRYLNFDEYQDGDYIPLQADGGFNQQTYPGGDRCPVVSEDVARFTGDITLLQDYSLPGNSSNKEIYLNNMDLGKLYFTGWTYRDDFNGTAQWCENAKIWGNLEATYAVPPEQRYDTYFYGDSGHLYTYDGPGGDGAIHNDWTASNQYLDQWFRMERWTDMGTIGEADGYSYVAANNVKLAENIGVHYTTGSRYALWHLGNYFRRSSAVYDLPDAEIKIYWSEIYVDTVQTRVELGDASTFSSCTHLEIQIPTAWSASEIIIDVNQGTFAEDETAYLFVVGSDGTASSGHAVTIGAAASSTLTAPTNLQSSTAHQGQ